MSYYQDRYCGAAGTGPGERHDFRALSRLGVSIWDTDRLRRLGLAFHPGVAPGAFGHHAHWSWRSILIQEVSRIANRDIGRRKLSPTLVRWVNGRLGTRGTRNTLPSLDIHEPVDVDTYYTGPSQSPIEGIILRHRAIDTVGQMEDDMRAYFTANPNPNTYPDQISDSEDDGGDDGN